MSQDQAPMELIPKEEDEKETPQVRAFLKLGFDRSLILSNKISYV
jgi:hypothetical protein